MCRMVCEEDLRQAQAEAARDVSDDADEDVRLLEPFDLYEVLGVTPPEAETDEYGDRYPVSRQPLVNGFRE